MKVLQINSVCGIGSTGRIATDIHNVLIKKGYESYIAYGRGLPKNCDNVIKIGTSFDNYIHVFKTRLLDMHSFGSRKPTLKFIKRIIEIDPDLIHLHNIHGYYVNIEILFKYLMEANKPVVWTLHDCWSFTGHCCHFDYVSCDKWKVGCFNCPQTRVYPKSFLLDNSKRNYLLKKDFFTRINNLTIVTPSIWLSNLVNQSFLKKYPIHVINNGIDLTIFKPIQSDFRQKYNLAKKYIILGVANNWEDRKGLDFFLKLSNVLDEDDIIVLVGIDNKQRSKLPRNILGIEKTNSAYELAAIYSAADVFVNPTLEDNFPSVNLEALACGTPIITFDTGGCAETIDEYTGVAIERANLLELINAIKNFKAKNMKIFAQNYCLRRAIEYFSKEKKYMEYIRLYESVTIK